MFAPHIFAQQTAESLEKAQRDLRLVPLAQALTSKKRWLRFMRLHIFAVWDFMSLLKRLQADVTCVDVPWLPKAKGTSARFIHEIVLSEESDPDGQGGYCSHFDLYTRAMREAGADLAPIMDVLEKLRGGGTLHQALSAAPVPAPVKSFVHHTLQVAGQGHTAEVAAAFLYGREAMLPHLFTDLLQASCISHGELTTLKSYFDRHIEVDGEDHGPKAQALLMDVCGSDPELWRKAQQSAAKSLALRSGLWNAIYDDVVS